MLIDSMERRIERLDNYLKTKGVSGNRAEILAGLSSGILTKARKGKNDIGINTIEKLLAVFSDLDRVWLLTGNGPMLNNAAPLNSVVNKGSIGGDINQNTDAQELNNLRLENERLRTTVQNYRERIEELKEEKRELLQMIGRA